jgi:hypothetical protein
MIRIKRTVKAIIQTYTNVNLTLYTTHKTLKCVSFDLKTCHNFTNQYPNISKIAEQIRS